MKRIICASVDCPKQSGGQVDYLGSMEARWTSHTGICLSLELAAPTQSREGTIHVTKLSHSGHDYIYNDTRKDIHKGIRKDIRKYTQRYRGSDHPKDCKATVVISRLSGEISLWLQEHSCKPTEFRTSTVVDILQKFTEVARNKALPHQMFFAESIWANVNMQIDQTYYQKDARIVMPNKCDTLAEIGNVRGDNAADDLFGNAFQPRSYYLFVDDKRRFLHVAMQYFLPTNDLQSRARQLLIRSHPGLLPVLRRSKSCLHRRNILLRALTVYTVHHCHAI